MQDSRGGIILLFPAVIEDTVFSNSFDSLFACLRTKGDKMSPNSSGLSRTCYISCLLSLSLLLLTFFIATTRSDKRVKVMNIILRLHSFLFKYIKVAQAQKASI